MPRQHYAKKSIRGIEKRIIDFVIFSDDLERSLNDENREHVLTIINTPDGETVEKESDHNTIITSFKIKWNKNNTKMKRNEIFNYKNEESQKKFYRETSNTNYLSSAFNV